MKLDEKWLHDFRSEIDRKRAQQFAENINEFMDTNYPDTPNTKGAMEAAAENFSICYDTENGSVVFMQGERGVFCMYPAVPGTFGLHRFCEELSGGNNDGSV